MPVRQVGRRHFLLGTGGAVLSIPFLSSLQPSSAKAQTVDQRFFIAYQTGHGGVWPQHMFPSESTLTNSHSLYNDHTIRWGRLATGAMSPVLTASMPQSLIDMMMVIQGLDTAHDSGHTTAASLGNYERRNSSDNPARYVPTIDQVLAAWSGFYGAGDPYMMKSMHVGSSMSWIERSNGVQPMDPATSPDVLFRTVLSTVSPYTPPSGPTYPTEPSSPDQPAPTPSTPTQPAPTEPDPSSPSPTPQPTPTSPSPTPSTPTPSPAGESRTHVLNRVVEHFNRLTSGAFGDAQRLSANDRARLHDHMDMVADLARRFDSVDPAVASKANSVGSVCDPQTGNTGNSDSSGDMYSPAYRDLTAWHQDYNAVFATAIACGASRIATVLVENTFHHSPSFTVDWEQWHEPIAHRAAWSRQRWASSGNLPEHPQDTLVTAKNNFYRDAFVDMIDRLHSIDAGDGTALLDQGLVMWTQESGPYTHGGDSIPVITAGSVDGHFNTGHYFDLRNPDGPLHRWGAPDGNDELYRARRPGILYNQWLSNILQSMGMSPSQFQRSHPYGWAGYGYARLDDPTGPQWHTSRLVADANNRIPKVTSGT